MNRIVKACTLDENINSEYRVRKSKGRITIQKRGDNNVFRQVKWEVITSVKEAFDIIDDLCMEDQYFYDTGVKDKCKRRFDYKTIDTNTTLS